MGLDIRTILVLLVLATVLMAGTLAIGVKRRSDGLAKWNLGLCLLSLGWLLLALRGHAPDLLTKAGANALFLTGLALEIAALLEFQGRRVPLWRPLLAGALFFAFLVPVIDSFQILTQITGIAFSVAFAAIALVVLRAQGMEKASPARWLLAGLHALGAVVLFARVVAVHLSPAAYPDVFAPQAAQLLAFVTMFALTIASSVTFLLMHRDRAESAILHLAMYDPLTELLNRRAFLEQAERELARARRMGVPFTVLMLDLDHFKFVNDAHGHQGGDRVLADFAALLQRSVRTEDLVGRYGGEEFCAILPGAPLQMAVAVGERVRSAAEQQPLAGLPHAVTVSIGVAVFQPGEQDVSVDEAISKADAALYRAKSEGRNRVVAIGPEGHGPHARIGPLMASLSMGG